VMLDHQFLHMQHEGRPWRLVAQETAKSGKPGHGQMCTAFFPVDSVLMTAGSALPRRDTGDGAPVSHGLFPSSLRWTLLRDICTLSFMCLLSNSLQFCYVGPLWRISDLCRSRCRGRSGAAGGRGRCRCRVHCRRGRCCCARCLLAPSGRAPPCRSQQMQVRGFGDPFHPRKQHVCVSPVMSGSVAAGASAAAEPCRHRRRHFQTQQNYTNQFRETCRIHRAPEVAHAVTRACCRAGLAVAAAALLSGASGTAIPGLTMRDDDSRTKLST